jgi:hypothetical protein
VAPSDVVADKPRLAAALRKLIGDGGHLPDVLWGDLRESADGSFADLVQDVAQLELRLRSLRAGKDHDLTWVRQELQALCGAHELAMIPPDDARFAWGHRQRAGSLSTALREMLESPTNLDERDIALVRALAAARDRTLTAEVLELGRLLATRCFGTDETVARAKRVFALRFNPAALAPLSDIARETGLPRFKVGEILERLLTAAASLRPVSPLVVRMLRLTEQAGLQDAPARDAALTALAGEPASWASVEKLAEQVLQLPVPPAPAAAPFDAPGDAQPLRVTSERPRTNLRLVRIEATRLVAAQGAASLTSLAGRCAVSGVFLDARATSEALHAVSDPAWLDDEQEWFTLPTGRKSALRSRVDKVLAVAREPMTISDIWAAATFDPPQSRQRRSHVTPLPTVIFARLLATVPGIRVSPSGYEAVDREPEQVLTGWELTVYRTLAAAGGVLALDRLLAQHRGEPRHSMWVAARAAPFVVVPAAGLLALRGWQVSPAAMLAAQASV